MATLKSVYFVSITIFLVSFCGKCSSNQSEKVQFITKFAQKSSEDWESDLIEPKILEGKLDRKKPEFSDDVENDQDIENKKLLLTDDEKKIKDDVDLGRKRNVRQVNSAYSHIYPTLTPQNPHLPGYPTPYRPATGVHGNGPYNYPNHQNSNLNPGHSQPNYYPPGQNPFQNTNPSYNQGSLYNNQSNTNALNPQYNQYSNQRYNSNSSFQGNIPQNGYNANQHTFTPTPANQWTPGYTSNNTRYNPSAPYGATPKYPSYNNPPNTYHSFNNSTPRTVINSRTGYNPQYNPSNPPYQSYPPSTNTQHNNYNGSKQWSPSSSNTQTPNNYPGNNFLSLTSDGRSLNVSRQSANNPSYTNNNPYNQQPYAPNSSPNPYSQNHPAGSNGNQNNQYHKEPDHFFYSPGNKDTRYDPRNNPSPNYSYSP
ncbi:uncharacterized protein DDB_G0280315-like [Maniola hyperantus]|uniref:uncharacterized protein DDB_G0280315-like n=1 Tax=Aphantopus hyperantus TaxID=2795564 RepID=UPI0015684020|nr:homeobox protein 2-like [Maniola hyperantus]